MTHLSFTIITVEDSDYTPASLQISTHVHLDGGGIVGSSSLYLTREEAEELIHELKDKLGTLRYAKQVA